MKITRKEFLGRLLGGTAGLAGAVFIAGCGSDSSGRGTDPGDPDAAVPPSDARSSSDAAHATSCTMNGTSSTISANHGHVLVVSKTDVTAATSKTYDIHGTADHTHSVTVTAAMFTALKGNTAIMMISSRDSGHTHSVTVMCA
jgi:hypothetical protein